MARDGQALWVLRDVKGGFNNVLGQEVLDAVAGSVAERIFQTMAV